MDQKNTSRILKSAAGILCLMMLVIVLFSAFCVASETGHDCSGEDCPVCALIRQCENTMRSIGCGTAARLSLILPFLFILFTAGSPADAFSQDTPVLRKVRLNN